MKINDLQRQAIENNRKMQEIEWNIREKMGRKELTLQQKNIKFIK